MALVSRKECPSLMGTPAHTLTELFFLRCCYSCNHAEPSVLKCSKNLSISKTNQKRGHVSIFAHSVSTISRVLLSVCLCLTGTSDKRTRKRAVVLDCREVKIQGESQVETNKQTYSYKLRSPLKESTEYYGNV